jgi:CheY-like chemotaxis protein
MGEPELTRLNEALQAEIAERKQAEQALRECARRKNQFLATLAHELRNPLATLTSAIHLIAAAPEQTEQVRALVGMMQQQLDQLVRLIGDLADESQLPAAESAATPQMALHKDDGAESLPALKILLVDDNQSAVHMMSRLLQKLGQDVHIADSGPAALDQVPKISPHIVISDVAMPGMSGYDLARRIRTLPLPRRPYLVAVTGYGQETDRQAALAAGFDKHLTKPVGVGTLEQLLRSQA